MKFKLTAAAIIVLICGGNLSAGQVEADLLQRRLNRLYFSVGDEALVFPNASFYLVCGSDTLARGLIDFTGPGIAVSRADSILAELDFSTECHSYITTAEIDTTSTIRIGVVARSENLCRRLVRENDSSRVVEFLPFRNDIELAIAFDSGTVDLVLALDELPVSREAKEYQSPAPLIAVMIPNPASPINDHALLTTSLYYRYSSPTPSLFDGLTPAVAYCLYPRDEVCRREYPYNPESGRKLAARLKVGAEPITMAYSDPSLEKCAIFFGDILSRDRLPVIFARTEPSVDFDLHYYEFDPERPTAGLGKMIEYLSEMTGGANEIIVSATNNIAEARNADSSKCQHFCDLASSRLIQEIGVFPLFRINYVVLTQDNVTNVQFSPGGALLADSLARIELPVAEGSQ